MDRFADPAAIRALALDLNAYSRAIRIGVAPEIPMAAQGIALALMRDLADRCLDAEAAYFLAAHGSCNEEAQRYLIIAAALGHRGAVESVALRDDPEINRRVSRTRAHIKADGD